MKWYEKSFNYLTYISIALYLLVFFGLWSQAPDYLNTINYWRQMLIGALLIFFFHPFRTVRFRDFHQKLAFASGVFLLGTSTLTQMLQWMESTFVQVGKKVLP